MRLHPAGALLLLALSGGRAAAQEAVRLRGDVSGDGRVTSMDALAVLTAAVGRQLPASFHRESGDTDADGALTARDALEVLLYVVSPDAAGESRVGRPMVRVSLSPDSLALTEGDSQAMAARLTGGPGGVIWRSSSSAVATVDAHGVVRGRSAGTATITAIAEADTLERARAVVTVAAAPVKSIRLPASALSLTAGDTLTVSAVALDARGAALEDRPVTWTSGDTRVATVTRAGRVTARSAGSTTLTASVEGVRASMEVTVSPAAVAGIEITPAWASLEVGSAVQLHATTRSAEGAVLSGRPITWMTSSPGVARVDAAGRVTGRAPGTAWITAMCEGVHAIVQVEVRAPVAARLTVASDFAVLRPGEEVGFEAAAARADGSTIAGAPVAWTSLDPEVASVDAAGVVHAVAVGSARVEARAGAAVDTAAVAVLGARTPLVTLLAEGRASLDATAGQTITVPLAVDLSRIAASGDLGSLQLYVTYDATLLGYVKGRAVAEGTADLGLIEPGRLGVAFVAIEPQRRAGFTVFELTFRVAPGAAAGRAQHFGVVVREPLRRTTLVTLEQPVVVAGSVRVVP